MNQYGVVVNVSTRPVGARLTADVPVAGGSLPVDDLDPFDETGGTVSLNGATLPYTALDVATGSLLLLGPLSAGAGAGAFVGTIPTRAEKIALVDLGDEGDSLAVIVPHTLDAVLGDGFRQPGQGEPVIITERAPGELVLVDVPGRSAVVGGDRIAEGEVPARSLAVGQVTNLVQDPQFTQGIRPNGDSWVVLGPDTVYPENNYAQCVGQAPDEPHGEHDFYITDLVPVEAGGTIRTSCEVRVSADSATTTTTTWAEGVRPGVSRFRIRAEFYNAAGQILSGPAQWREWLSDEDQELAVATWTPVSTVFTVPAGYTGMRVKVETAWLAAGTIDVIKPTVQALWSRVQGANYVEGESGWSFDENTSQVQDLSVIGALGAGWVSTYGLTLGSDDLSEVLDALPKGCIAYGTNFSGTNAGPVTAASPGTKLFEMAWGPTKPGRLYRQKLWGQIVGTVAYDVFDLVVRAKVDGTAPDTTTPQHPGAYTRFSVPPNAPPPATGVAGPLASNFSMEFMYTAGGNYDQTRWGLFMHRSSGTGSGSILLNDTNRRFIWTVEDLGYQADAIEAASLSQKFGIVQADPVQTYTKSWPCLWSRAYEADNNPFDEADTQDLYQGYYTAARGNTRSLFGFDDAAIRAALVGATIKTVKLRYRVKHTYYPTGMTIRLASGGNSTKPATWSGVTQNRISWTGRKAGTTYNVGLPLAIGSEFQSGTTKCLGFGPGPDTDRIYNGSMHGFSTMDAPVLTITYTR